MDRRKGKKLKGLLETHTNKLEAMESCLKTEKRENRIIGWGLVIGVPFLNWLIPRLVGTRWFSMNINPHIGLIDVLVILAGLRFLWKSK